MWDTHKMLKDWECMTNLLLNNNSTSNDRSGTKTNYNEDSTLQQLDDQHERYLIEIINCCVKQAATGEYPIARRSQNRKVISNFKSKIKLDTNSHFHQFSFLVDSKRE